MEFSYTTLTAMAAKMTGRYLRVFEAVLKRTVYFSLPGNVATSPLWRSGELGVCIPAGLEKAKGSPQSRRRAGLVLFFKKCESIIPSS